MEWKIFMEKEIVPAQHRDIDENRPAQHNH
jgi:hypothetical protein